MRNHAAEIVCLVIFIVMAIAAILRGKDATDKS